MEKKYIASMKKIHDIYFEFLIKFDRIAQENNIEWYLDGGVAIGALREGDFLAWDDDLDITIKEEDMSRFLAIDWGKYGWSTTNPDGKIGRVWITRLFLLNHKIERRGIEDFLFVDVFSGFKQRNISKFRKMRHDTSSFISYVKSYKFKEISQEYNAGWIILRILFFLIPFTSKFWSKHTYSIIEKAKIISETKRKVYGSYDWDPKNFESHYLLVPGPKGKIRGFEVPVPYKMRETTVVALGDIMIPPKNTPQKPDHGITLIK